jgi:molybdate transport system substrate-binding protein
MTMETRAMLAVCLAAAASASASLSLPGCSKTRGAGHTEAIRVAAAADLAWAFRDVGAAFEARTGQKVTFSFGSTGLLEAQIAEGAPFDVFAAANVSFADDAIRAGACLADSKALYGTGRIVLYAPEQATVRPAALSDLTDPRIAKIAIANPDHAPYGKAARQAMIRAGVWAAVERKVVYAENVQQALEFAQSGNADAAIVALSLAKVTAGPKAAADWKEIPVELYDRIDQALVVCTRGPAGVAAGRRFTEFVSSAEGRGVMRRYGFLLPGEAMTASAPSGR